VPLDKGSLGRQRLPAKAVRPWCRRSSADFGGFPFTEDYFSSNHWTRETCLEKPRSWGRRTLPSDEPKIVFIIAMHDMLTLAISRADQESLKSGRIRINPKPGMSRPEKVCPLALFPLT